MNARARDRELARVRKVCAALPEVEERPSLGSSAWFVRGKKTISMFVDDHHGDGILGLVAVPESAVPRLAMAEPVTVLCDGPKRAPVSLSCDSVSASVVTNPGDH